jgi:hypothetical protein
MKERLSDTRYAIPFGSYQSTQAAEYPANEVLIGREGERAYFLNLLFNQGRRGAFLITGHRGSGKSTFVRYCVEEYRQSCFRRYQSSTVGRAVFWDRVLLVIGALIAAATALFLSQFLHLLGPWGGSVGAAPRLAVQLAVTLVLCYVFLEAFELSALVAEGGALPSSTGKNDDKKPKKKTQSSARPEARRRFKGAFFFVFSALLLLLAFPLALPGAAVAWLALALAIAVQVSTAFGFRLVPVSEPETVPIDDSTWTLGDFQKKWRRWPAIVAVGLVGAGVVSWGLLRGPGEVPAAVVFGLWSQVVLALGLGYLLRAADLSSFRRAHKRNRFDEPPQPTGIALASAHRRYFFVGFFLLLSGFYLAAIGGVRGDGEARGLWLSTSMFCGAVTCSGWFLRFWERRQVAEPERSSRVVQIHARPRLLVELKSVCLTILGLQLVVPALQAARNWGLHWIPQGWLAPGSLLELPGPLFVSSADDLAWVAGVVALVVLMVGLEKEWILRPLARVRDEPSLHERGPSDSGLAEFRHFRRRIVEQTLVWRIYSAWLPVLTVRVNLGFDDLDYHRVIEAMAFGLRQAFRKYFLSWHSGFTFVRRGLAYGACALAAVVAGDHWFGAAPLAKGEVWCGKQGLAQTKPALELICDLGGETAVVALVWTPVGLDRDALGRAFADSSFARALLTLGVGLPSVRTDALDFRPYHLVVFVLIAWLLRRMAAWLSILPYTALDRRMSRLLEGLSHRIHQESQREGFSLARLIPFYRTAETVERKEGGPFDPRTTELTFLEILEDIQDPATQLLQLSRHRISPPVPEVIFVFDELDKVGLSAGAGNGRVPSESNSRSNLEHSSAEQQRSQKLHRLFADLKNLLATGEARFLFIGGRNLHDEWLADQSARSPLLTHIFQAEIYLPSLLTDHLATRDGVEAVRHYLLSTERRAWALARFVQRRRMLPWPILELERRRPASFQHATGPPPRNWPRLIQVQGDGEEAGSPVSWNRRFQADFEAFLAYRSVGSLKRLQELVEGFVRPTGRIVGNSAALREVFDCQHVLRFTDSDLFRIQLTADIFWKVSRLLRVRIHMRDDKLATGLLYLTDYLLKFHRRAFSMADMERVDELVDVHRAPDLRTVLRQLVLSWTDRYLHRIRNGMYDFRFQSEFAREIEYASRISERDLAAFNFTLDESQALKTLYSARLKSPEAPRSQELVAALGELHEFDEEFEVARQHYRQAIEMLDQTFTSTTGNTAPLLITNDGLDEGATLRRQVTWAVARVRLLLQIALTFERTQDLEQAQVEYRTARTVASSAVRAMVATLDTPGLEPSDFSFTLKHLNILFEPAFAEAWLSEKVLSGVDTGSALLEGELWQLRESLPFVNPYDFFANPTAENASQIRHSNFSLILASLHDKAGDLYFFKGRQEVHSDLGRKLALDDATVAEQAQGYLLQAQYHYALGLHDVRRFNDYRRRSSALKLNAFEQPKPGETIVVGGWPEFPSRLGAATLLDFSETLLARVSLIGLFNRLEPGGCVRNRESFEHVTISATEAVRAWLDGSETSPCWGRVLDLAFPGIELGGSVELSDWLGHPSRDRVEKDRRLLASAGPTTSVARLASAVLLSLVAARLHDEAGYPKSITRENLRLAATVTQLFWWRALLGRCHAPKAQVVFPRATLRDDFPVFLLQLFDLALDALEEAVAVQRASAIEPGAADREASEEGEPDAGELRLANPNPRSTAVYAAGLGLALLAQADPRKPATQARIGRVAKLLAPWYQLETTREGLRKALKGYLECNSFPVLNRLFGLKILVDDGILGAETPHEETGPRLHELLDLNEYYGSSLHFSPLQSGLSLAAAYLSKDSALIKASGRSGDKLKARARQDLYNSLEMVTMRRAYYESISDLYYLFDDFNDRMIHYNHAIQMMAIELTSYLLAALDEN